LLRAENSQLQARVAASRSAQSSRLKLAEDTKDAVASARAYVVGAVDDHAAVAAQTASEAKQAADEHAAVTTELMRMQTAELLQASDRGTVATYATLITSLFGFMTLLAGFIWKAYTDRRDHKWAQEAAENAATTAATFHTLAERQIGADSEANGVNAKLRARGRAPHGNPL
jgi:hypothetical protein